MKFCFTVLCLVLLNIGARADEINRSDLFYDNNAIKLSLSKLQLALTEAYKYPVSKLKVSLVFDSLFSNSETCDDRHYRGVSFTITEKNNVHTAKCDMTIAKACLGRATDGEVHIYGCQSETSDLPYVNLSFDKLLASGVVKF